MVREYVYVVGVREEDAEDGEKEEADTLQRPLNGQPESEARRRHLYDFFHLLSNNGVVCFHQEHLRSVHADNKRTPSLPPPHPEALLKEERGTWAAFKAWLVSG